MPPQENNLNEKSWNIFDSWNYKNNPQKVKYHWEYFDELIPFHNAIIEKQYEHFFPLLDKWNSILKDLGKDPTLQNWNKFRPLRLSREEDWVDWLAFLIDTSTTGTFAQELLQIKGVRNYKNPDKVLREDISKGYRADLIIQWKNKNYTHLEVKVGDPNLKKTFPTSEVFRQKYMVKKGSWTNFILLLSNQLPEWDYLVETKDSDTIVDSITWEDVCISLRRALLSKESTIWKVWAYTYLGAVEQLLIGYPGHLLNKNLKPKENLDKKILILEKSLHHE